MMDTILGQNEITFKELEKKIFQFICWFGVELTKLVLEGKDVELHKSRDTKKYRDKGFRVTTIKTLYGDVTYRRHVYQTSDEGGKKYFIYLLDEALKLDKIGLMSINFAEKIADSVTENSFRVAAESLTSTTGQSISAGGAWKVTQRLGERICEEEKQMVKEMDADVQKPEKEVKILFEEMDGVWLKMQGKDHKKIPKQEVKVACTYEGWDEDTKVSRLCGKKVLAGIEGSKEFHAKREAQIRSTYDTDEIQYRILNGDGGSWINDPYESEVVYQLDPFHVRKAIREKINRDEEARSDIEVLYEAGETDVMLDYIEMYANSVDTGDEKDKRAERAWELYKYLSNNKDGLLSYKERGFTLPEAPEGMRYGNMGVQENQNCTVITMRMKGKRKRWSPEGGNHMAKLLYKKENKELHQVVERYAEELIWNFEQSEIVNILSAAKAPKKDGKGNAYLDIMNMRIPMKDAERTAVRNEFLKIFG